MGKIGGFQASSPAHAAPFSLLPIKAFRLRIWKKPRPLFPKTGTVFVTLPQFIKKKWYDKSQQNLLTILKCTLASLPFVVLFFIKCRLKLNKVINWKTKNKHKFNFRESKEVSFSEPPKMEEEEREHQEVQKKSRYFLIYLFCWTENPTILNFDPWASNFVIRLLIENAQQIKLEPIFLEIRVLTFSSLKSPNIASYF